MTHGDREIIILLDGVDESSVFEDLCYGYVCGKGVWELEWEKGHYVERESGAVLCLNKDNRYYLLMEIKDDNPLPDN